MFSFTTFSVFELSIPLFAVVCTFCGQVEDFNASFCDLSGADCNEIELSCFVRLENNLFNIICIAMKLSYLVLQGNRTTRMSYNVNIMLI